MASLYIDPGLGDRDHAVGDVVELHGHEARHAATVARVRPGETLSVGDGRGLVVTGSVLSAEQDAVRVEVRTTRFHEPEAVELWLAQALAKGDRDELAIQAATELGVAGVIPWAAERSVTRWVGPKVEKGLARWRTIVTEAAKQSIRPRVPVVGELCTTAQLLAQMPAFLTLVLDPDAEDRLTGLPLALEPATASDPIRVLLVVGPEGGIADGELERFVRAGARTARLGAEVLRTSTAGPAAIAVLNARLARW